MDPGLMKGGFKICPVEGGSERHLCHVCTLIFTGN